VAPADAPGLGPFVEIGASVLSVRPDARIEPGCLALNSVQRRNAQASSGMPVEVLPFSPPAGGFEAAVATLELDFVTRRGAARAETLDAKKLEQVVKARFAGQVLSVGQKVTFEFAGTNYLFAVADVAVDKVDTANRALLGEGTALVFEALQATGIKIVGQRAGMSSSLFKRKDFNFSKLGIGGLDKQFGDIFRRAFASRVFPPGVVAQLGIQHVKGMLLHGPPGTGKTLIARQIGKMLNGKEPKVVNGPEILSKYVGQAEENIRNLFKDAEADQQQNGDESDLHIIIFDEIDAICKSRGSVRDGTGVHDSIVNQLLTKVDGVDALNNILLIGMTNRKDMLDEALMRPGRLEVQVEIGLPDEAGRHQILGIHTAKQKKSGFLGGDVDLADLAARTKNFSGAEIEGLVKSATSFALNRQVNVDDLGAPIDENAIRVTMADFETALLEVKPAFGVSQDAMDAYRPQGIIPTGDKFEHIMATCRALAAQVETSERSPIISCLLEGAPGAGKTALAATLALESGFPYVKFISADTMVGFSESAKCSKIAKVFDDAYKSPLSVVVLDDLERLLEYVAIGPRFSNAVLQTLLVLVKRQPPKGHRLLVLATSSQLPVLETMDLAAAFNVQLNVPLLAPQDVTAVLTATGAFAAADAQSAAAVLGERVAIKRLLLLVEMACQRLEAPPGAPRPHVPLDRFTDVVMDCGGA
jgi:vesicle-fusing ATPase